MAFKNLEDLFNQKMTQLYGKYSTGDSVEYKPNNPNKDNVTNDTRVAPIGSVLRDEKRISSFLVSSAGVRWFALQALLQSGNPISETRVFNPLFINANLIPYIHLRRSLRTQKDDILTGNDASPASLGIGKTGRLQKETAADAKSNIVGGTSAGASILSLLSISKLVGTLSGLVSFGDGTLTVDQRPELDFQGNYYSVLLWKGYSNTTDKIFAAITTALQAAGASLQTVGINTSLSSLLKFPTVTIPNAPSSQKYFINNDSTATRYVKKSTMLDRPPFLLTDTAIALSTNGDTAQNEFTYPDLSLESRYKNDNRLEFIRDILKSQQTTDFASFSVRGFTGGLNKTDLTTDPGNLTSITLRQKVSQGLTKRKSGFAVSDPILPSWYHDTINEGPAIIDISGVNSSAPIGELLKKAPAVGEDYIKVLFEDNVNSKLIPFRAILADLQETVTPSFSENKYIGRIERNIVYQGAIRSLGFTLTVAAYNPDEMKIIWERINYLTGLAFPSEYTSDGYMVPGIVLLTIGDYYNRQPGYLSQISNTIDEDFSWELEEGQQVPQAINIAIQFQVIEKHAMTVSSSFYGFGEPIS